MIKNYKNCFMSLFFFLPIMFYLPLFEDNNAISISNTVNEVSISYPNEKRADPPYDKILRDDGSYHYRVLFWVPKETAKFVPYANNGVNTDVSSHGPVEKWSVKETQITNGNEKLVYILVPKTFVYLYGNGFEKVIHLKYN